MVGTRRVPLQPLQRWVCQGGLTHFGVRTHPLGLPQSHGEGAPHGTPTVLGNRVCFTPGAPSCWDPPQQLAGCSLAAGCPLAKEVSS
jgi:hypothetical protein